MNVDREKIPNNSSHRDHQGCSSLAQTSEDVAAVYGIERKLMYEFFKTFIVEADSNSGLSVVL